MPIYRYECINCKEEFEKIMSLADRYENKIIIACPSCNSEENNILISRTSFSLKGAGWYKDGYSSAKKPPEDDN